MSLRPERRVMPTDPTAHVASLPDDELQALHKHLDSSAVDDPASVEAHHLVASEMLKRGMDHGHDGEDDWSVAVVVMDQAVVKSVDDIGVPAGMEGPLAEALGGNGGVVTVLLTTNGYVLKAEPTVSDVHEDAIMGAYPIRPKKKRKPKPDPVDDAEDDSDDEEYMGKARDGVKEGDFVSWNSSGGRARGRVEHVMTEGTLGVPDSDFSIEAKEDDPAVLIRVYRPKPDGGWRETETLVGHRASTLSAIEDLAKADGYKVPEGVQAAARRAVKWIEDGMAGDGFTSVGRNRARQLASGGTVGRDTLVKMRAYFARHGVQRGGHAALEDGEPTPWRVAWDAWGGDAGRSWANNALSDMDKAYDPILEVDERGVALYEAYEAIAEEFGPWSPEEAHYMDSDDNPFQDQGMNCANCVFFMGGGGCEIVEGQVDPMGLCKLWVIPEERLAVDEEELLETMDEDDLAEFGAFAADMDDDDMEKAGAEGLRDYWREGGKGKISWGSGGDFTACVAAVSKYMNPEQAKGYCAIRHREATGMWPGDKKNRANKAVYAIDDPHTLVMSPGAPATTFTLPDGSVYTFSTPAPIAAQPVPISKDRSAAGRKAALARWGNRGPDAPAAAAAGGPPNDPPRRPGMGDGVPMSDEDFGMLQEGSAGSHIVGRTSDGAPIFSAERQALHDRIVSEAADGVPVSSDPTYHIMGGGPAAGKSSAIESGIVNVPGADKAVQINADEVKGSLKDADKLEREDWAAFTHEESSYVAKRIQAAAIERGQDAVLDGTGDSSASSIRRKIEGARAAGYKVEGHYVTCPTETAVSRAQARGERTGRFVPESIIRGTHSAVSRVVPEVASDFDSFTLVDTSARTPRKVASATRGNPVKVEDQALWDEFTAKGAE